MSSSAKSGDSTADSRPAPRHGVFAKVVSVLKATVGWACIALLVIFVVTNWQSTEVHVLNASLTAPVGLVVVLSAVLGGLGAGAFKTMLSWVIRDEDDK